MTTPSHVWINAGPVASWRRVPVVKALKGDGGRVSYRVDVRRSGAEKPLHVVRPQGRVLTDEEFAAR